MNNVTIVPLDVPTGSRYSRTLSQVEKAGIVIEPNWRAPKRPKHFWHLRQRSAWKRFMKNRNEKQRQLARYCVDHPEQYPIVLKVVEAMDLDRRFSEERTFYGGSHEVRQWERVDGPAMDAQIGDSFKVFGITSERAVAEFIGRVLLALPEMFIAGPRSHSQDKLDDLYHRIECGNYAFHAKWAKKLTPQSE